MIAPVIAFEAAPATPSARAEHYRDQVSDAYCALTARIEKDGLAWQDVLNDYDKAKYRECRHWEHRAELAERSLRRVLDLDISDEVRTYVAAAVAGKSRRATPTRAWSNAEHRMIEAYRRLGDADRQVLRHLFDRLAETSESNRELGRSQE